MRRLICLLTALSALTLGAQAQDTPLRLAVPVNMVESGFLQHLLPRFKFKHRIAIDPVTDGSTTDMILSDSATGARIFQSADGTIFRLEATAEDPRIAKFQDWLDSAPGKAAIEGFPKDGPPLYSTAAVVEAAPEVIELDGDVQLGSKLALAHCGRCHVVDERNRMGGIGSSPSFAAMRARPNWTDLYLAFWSQNPHPSFTEVIGVTAPFDASNMPHIAPMRITLEDIDAITAFVETITPKDLGRPVQSQ